MGHSDSETSNLWGAIQCYNLLHRLQIWLFLISSENCQRVQWVNRYGKSVKHGYRFKL